jgi:hypothetical protein
VESFLSSLFGVLIWIEQRGVEVGRHFLGEGRDGLFEFGVVGRQNNLNRFDQPLGMRTARQPSFAGRALRLV